MVNLLGGLARSVLASIVKSSDPRIETPDGRIRQVAALVYRVRNHHLQFLLITSRRSGRWILPKGWPQRGKSFAQSALMEAYEEAGVRGDVAPVSIGSYTYQKPVVDESGNGRLNVFRVEVFPVKYLRQEKDWPERGERKLEWLSPEETMRRLEEPELKALIASFAPELVGNAGRSGN